MSTSTSKDRLYNGICVEVSTEADEKGKRVAIYNANDDPQAKRIELTFAEAIYLAETIMGLIK